MFMQMQPDWREERHKVNSINTVTTASLEKPSRADIHTYRHTFSFQQAHKHILPLCKVNMMEVIAYHVLDAG